MCYDPTSPPLTSPLPSPNPPQSHLLLPYCPAHILDQTHTKIHTEDLYFAHGTCTSILQASFHDEPVAVKIWRGASLSKSSRQKFVQRLSKELDNWKRIEHPNISPFFGVVPGFGHLPALVLPYYHNGHVNDYLARNPSADTLHILAGVAAALNYMHNLSPPLAHGDVKGSNILISKSNTPLLSDIGLAALPTPQDWSVGTCEGTRWMAPEVMDPPPPPDDTACTSADTGAGAFTSYVTPQSDVYSFGMTALELYTHRPPFAHRRFYGGVVFDVIRGVRPPRPPATECAALTDGLWALMSSCWAHEPRERPVMGVVEGWLGLLGRMGEGAGGGV